MNSTDLQNIRTLLNNMATDERPLVLSSNGSSGSYIDCPYSDESINWMISNNLIIQTEQFEIQGTNIHVVQITELGSMVSFFGVLTVHYDLENQELFNDTGTKIYTVLNKYNENEIDPLIKLLTQEEQEAYQLYYSTCIWNAIGNRGNTATRSTETTASGLLPMFSLSVLLGDKDSNEKRTNDYVLKKCVEELGELALELQIEDGLSYKEPGEDGVVGEAVDLAITAMDMFALQNPCLTPEQLQNLFLAEMNRKLEKWKRTIGK